MGIVLAIYYIPAYVVITILVLVALRVFSKPVRHSGLTDNQVTFYIFLGFISGISTTLFFMSQAPDLLDYLDVSQTGDGGLPFVVLVAGLSLIFPVVFAILGSVLFGLFKCSTAFCYGVLLSNPTIPWLTWLFFRAMFK